MTISEATRYKKETGENLPSWQEQIASYENKGYYIHFSNVPRMGLYLVNKYNTPIGFYAYPLDRNKMADFATDRPYAIIIKPKTETKLLELKTYSESDLKADIAKLEKLGYSKKVMDKAIKEARNKTPGGKIWNITRVLSSVPEQEMNDEQEMNEAKSETVRGGGPTGKWTILFKNLGYDGVNDDCLSIIHPSEECQAVFFDTTKLDLVKVIDKSKKPVFDNDQLGLGMSEGQIKGLAFDPEKLDQTLSTLKRKKQNDTIKKIVRIALKNDSTPVAALNVILKYPNAFYLLDVLRHPKAPPEYIAKTLQRNKSDRDVVYAVAKNPSTPVAILNQLASDKKTDVRASVADNTGAPVELLDMLAKDKQMAVRRNVAENPKTRKETLAVLAKDKDGDVARGVARNRNTPKNLFYTLAKTEPIPVAGNPSTPVEILTAFAKHKEISVREALAENPSTPVEILIGFSKSKQPYFRQLVAGNPKTPADILKILVNDKNLDVREAANEELARRNLAESVLNKVLTKLLYL